MLIRSKLPLATLCALRLVCRAARDDLVDGRCTALKFRPPTRRRDGALAAPPTQALLSLAGRLRNLTRLDLSRCGSACGMWMFGVEDADEFAAALERLPRPWVLTSLELGNINFGAGRLRVNRGQGVSMASWLAGAVGRLQTLRSLRFHVHSCGDAALAMEGAKLLLRVARRLPALDTLGMSFYWLRADELLRQVPIEQLLPLQQLRELELRDGAVALLPALLAPAATSQLTALQSLSANLWDASPPPGLEGLWRAPFLSSQLTRLELKGLDADDDAACDFLGALSKLSRGGGGSSSSSSGSGSGGGGGSGGTAMWSQLRSLKVTDACSRIDCPCDNEYAGLLSAGALRGLLAAVDPAVLEELVVEDCQEGAVAALAARAGDFTALKRLRLDSRDFFRSEEAAYPRRVLRSCNRPAACWRTLQQAPLPCLESLDVGAAGWLLWQPERLAALLSAPWATSVAELVLTGGDGPHAQRYCDALKPAALAALAALPRLRRLTLHETGLDAAALEAAAAPAAQLAAQLAELNVWEIGWDSEPQSAGLLVALGRLRFARLQRLTLRLCTELTLDDLEAFGATGAPWLARLSFLELGDRSWMSSEAVWAAARDCDGPLRALHRGGGKLVW